MNTNVSDAYNAIDKCFEVLGWRDNPIGYLINKSISPSIGVFHQGTTYTFDKPINKNSYIMYYKRISVIFHKDPQIYGAVYTVELTFPSGNIVKYIEAPK